MLFKHHPSTGVHADPRGILFFLSHRCFFSIVQFLNDFVDQFVLNDIRTLFSVSALVSAFKKLKCVMATGKKKF